MFYQGIVASVLLYGSKTWVLPPSGLKVLEGFNVEVACHLTGMRPKKVGGYGNIPTPLMFYKQRGCAPLRIVLSKGGQYR